MADAVQRELLLRAVESYPQRLLVLAPDFRILAASGGAAAAALQGPCHQALFGRMQPCEGCAVRQVLDTRAPAWSPRCGELDEASERICVFAYPLLQDGRLEAVVALEIEPAPRSLLEEQLRRSNAFLRNLITSAVDGVIAADRKGRVIIFNDAASEIFGYTVEEALAGLDVRRIYPDGLEREVMRQLRSPEHGGRGKLRSFPVEVLHRDGSRIPINLNAAIIYEGDREVATIGFFHDLRERLRMQKELEKTQLQLLQAEKMASLGKLAAGVAHQLNNPLGGIILFAKLILEEYDLPPAVREDLNRVLHDAQRCRDTVKELLEFTRQTRHLMRPHDIHQAITRTLFLLKSQSLFHNIEIETRFDPQVPPVTSDIQQLNHLFMNLILNAAQAMAGSGRLSIRTQHLPESGRVRVEVSDTGPGIPPEVLPHIFEPFFTTKPEGEGTGLGLSLAYGIVQNHGGVLSAVSEPGKGATFVIELPVQPTHGGGSGSE
ncbi:MAG: ATP-binding protein [Desulfobacterales bacterium]